ncbi:hypothetical protein VEE63_47390 [Escherichia coli]|nr:hypothetical protein VEE63_47390 [Escherichia coli]
MFVPFLIMLREGLEAALIVSLIASYLKRTQRGRWIGVMWIGVLLAAALCLGLGIFINETTGEFPQKEQELFEGIVAVIAVVILTWMVFWMRKVSRNVKVQLEQAVDSALQRGNHHGWALVMMVFFAVAREGLESVFFLLAAFQQDVGIWPPLGAMLGLATAVVLGFLLYWGGIRLNLGAFFKWTSLFILFVAAGLAAGAIRAFHEAGLWNHLSGNRLRYERGALNSLAFRYADGRYLWLSGSAERQRSRRLVYLSHPGAGGICSAAARRGDSVSLRVTKMTQTFA